MKYRPLLLGGLLTLACLQASAQSTAISYQGNLENSGLGESGPFDFTFALFNAGTNGAQVGVTVTNLNVQVANGFFTTMMDFGTNTFLGSNRWVEVSVRTNGSTSAFFTLSPRQPVTPAPFALYALRAGSGLVGPAGLSGTNGVSGTNGAAGTAGQNAITVYGTSLVSLTVIGAAVQVPGLLITNLLVPTNCVVYVSTDGSFRTTSAAATGFSVVDVYLKIDNQIPTNGGYANLPSLNTSGVTKTAGHWALSQTMVLSPTNHNFEVNADLYSGSAASVSGGTGSTDQGELTVMFLKQ